MGTSKYTLEFKLQAVDRCTKEGLGTDQLGRELGVSGSNIRKWIKFYELYGVSSLVRMKNSTYSPRFKLKVLQSVSSGMSIQEAARKYNIAAESSIITWRNRYEKIGILGLENKPGGRPKTMSEYKRKKGRRTNH